MTSLALLAGAGLLAGAMNALAGGGSFVSLPALIACGVSPVLANASSTVALFPGGLASAWVYRDGRRYIVGVPVPAMLAATLMGGLIGSLLLLVTPARAFDVVLPWLLLVATLALSFGRRIAPWLQARVRIGRVPVLVMQFVLGIYGGYFGGAVGLMMVAAWGLLGQVDLKALNPPRTLMVSAANTVAVICFAVAGAVQWRETVVLGGAAMLGGVLGAQLGKRLPPKAVAVSTVTLSVVVTIVFFVRAARR